MLLPLPKIMADNVHNHINLFCDVSPGLPTYINQITHNIKFNLLLTPTVSPPNCPTPTYTIHNVTQYTVPFAADLLTPLPKLSNSQHTQIKISNNIQFHLMLKPTGHSQNCPNPKYTNHMVTQYTVPFSAHSLKLLTRLYNYQHTQIIMSHNIQFHLLLTPSIPSPNCPTPKTQNIMSHNIQFHLLLTPSVSSPNSPTPNIHKSKYQTIYSSI